MVGSKHSMVSHTAISFSITVLAIKKGAKTPEMIARNPSDSEKRSQNGRAQFCQPRIIDDVPRRAPALRVTQRREFCKLLVYAVALGVLGAFAGLVFLWVIKFGGFEDWQCQKDSWLRWPLRLVWLRP